MYDLKNKYKYIFKSMYARDMRVVPDFIAYQHFFEIQKKVLKKFVISKFFFKVKLMTWCQGWVEIIIVGVIFVNRLLCV